MIEKIDRTFLFGNEKQFTFLIKEYFISELFPCLINENLKKKDIIFNSIIEHMNEYTDILSFVNTRTEILKMKNILFSKHQIALFNLISLPEIPIKENFKKKVSGLYKYSMDYNDQDREIINLNEKVKSANYIMSSIDKKLIDLID